MKLVSLNTEGFEFAGSEIGMLLVHGFTGSPGELRPLGEYLSEKGYTVICPRLPGHGTSIADLEKHNWKDWQTTVAEAFQTLKEKTKIQFVIGFSMGGLLSLDLAEREEPNGGLVCLSTPIVLQTKKRYFINVLKYFKRYEKKNRPRIRNYETFHYELYPVKPALTMLKEMPKIREKLKKISCPIFVLQSRLDRTVHEQSAETIFQNVSSIHKELHWLTNSGHVVTLDLEHQELFEKINLFINRSLEEKSGGQSDGF